MVWILGAVRRVDALLIDFKKNYFNYMSLLTPEKIQHFRKRLENSPGPEGIAFLGFRISKLEQ